MYKKEKKKTFKDFIIFLTIQTLDFVDGATKGRPMGMRAGYDFINHSDSRNRTHTFYESTPTIFYFGGKEAKIISGVEVLKSPDFW